MISLSEYIKQEDSHIRNIYIIDDDILDEDLNKIIYPDDGHVYYRKLGLDDPTKKLSTNNGGVTNKNIGDIFREVDHIILEALQLKRLSNENRPSKNNEVGITKDEKIESIMIICFVVNYNESDSKYDILLKTVGRRDYFQSISDVKLRIYLKGNYKKIDWDVPKHKKK